MRRIWTGVSLWTRRYASVADRVEGREVVWKTGEMGRLADGNCTLRFGQTTVLAAVVCDTSKRPSLDRTLFQVEYRERMSATSRFPRSWNRREVHQTDRETCVGRAIDRALRPLFPPFLGNDVSVTATVLSADYDDSDPEIVAIHAASAALMCSDLPWYGPLGACKIALVNDSLLANPSPRVLADAQMALTFVGTRNKVVMLEATGREVSGEVMSRALDLAHEKCQQMIDGQWQLSQKLQRKKRSMMCMGADPVAAARIEDLALSLFEEIYSVPRDKTSRSALRGRAKKQVEEKIEQQGGLRSDFARIRGSSCVSPTDLVFGFMMVENKVLRRSILEKGIRPDGRSLLDLRPVSCQRGVLPTVHGSAIFERGETQSLCAATIGNEQAKRISPTVFGVLEQQLMVQYSFPSYAVNEITNSRGISRREKGHSFLTERALAGVMPCEKDFPFPVLMVAETTSSNGSSSMAAVCGGSLAMMDAGVPLQRPVAGTSIGLMTDREQSYFENEVGGDVYQEGDVIEPDVCVSELLTDIQGVEDALGDADFKIAASSGGFTALQLDVKLPGGVSMETVKRALLQSKKPLEDILGSMNASGPEKQIPDKPAFDRMEVDPQNMGLIIGKKGVKLQQLEEETGARLVTPPGGGVWLYAPSQTQMHRAKMRILDLQGLTVHEGEIYPAKVVQIFDHGAFVELPNGFHVLLHISELCHERIVSVEEVLKEGEVLNVKCIGRDNDGNITLSRKALLE